MVNTSGRVLVLGDDVKIFLAVVRSLGRAGLEVHAAPYDRKAAALKSRYIAKIHYLPRYADGAESWLQSLAAVLRRESIDLVIPCVDRDIVAIDAHRRDLAEFRLAIPNPAAMTLLFDKEQTRRLAASLGVPVVAGGRLGAEATAKDLAGRYGLPLVVKPRRSYWPDKLDGSDRVHILESEAEIARALAAIGDRSRCLVEGYFDGAGGGVSVLAHDGRILQAFQHGRLREGRAGASSYRISQPVNPAILDACRKICGHVKLTGVCMFEFRHNRRTGAWVLLETNARFWGSMPLPVSLGVDFPLCLYELLVERKEHPQIPYRAGIRSRNFILDGFNLMNSARHLRPGDVGPWALGLAGFMVQPVGWLSGRERSDTFVGDDLAPAFWECGLVVKGGCTALARKLGWAAGDPGEAKVKSDAPRPAG